MNGGQANPGVGGSKVLFNPQKPMLGPEASATLRDQLVKELKEIASSDDAAIWAQRTLGAKNGLSEVDAKQVEDAFEAKLATVGDVNGQSLSPAYLAPRPSRQTLAGTTAADGIDKSRLTHPEPRRFRDKEHIKFVAKQACLVCGRRPADAHHLRFAQHRALSRKVSDEFSVPLCRGHHREAHRSGDEAAWWKKVGVDPTTTARALWLETRPLPTTPDIANKPSSEPSVGVLRREPANRQNKPISQKPIGPQ
jgi:hypothetical protein